MCNQVSLEVLSGKNVTFRVISIKDFLKRDGLVRFIKQVQNKTLTIQNKAAMLQLLLFLFPAEMGSSGEGHQAMACYEPSTVKRTQALS